jgi:hypothetical protein
MRFASLHMDDFISEDDLHTFDGWLKYQAVDPTNLTPDEMALWRSMFDEMAVRRAKNRKVGRMKLRRASNEYRYAVAVREGDALWLVFWIRRSRRGEFFFFQPRGEQDWNPHTSYHLDGTLHVKSHDKKTLPARQRQPLTEPFHGVEPIGSFMGHGLRSVGAICDLADLTEVFELRPDILGPRHGSVVVDLVEAGCDPIEWPGTEISRRVFADTIPNVVVRIFA